MMSHLHLLGRWVLFLLAVLTLTASPEARAQGRPAPAPAGKVSVTLLVVAATDSHAGVDPRLGSLARHLSFLRYKGYDLLTTHNADISEGGSVTFSIDGARRVNVGLVKVSAEKAQFRVEMYNQGGKLLDTTLSVNRNGTFIVAGPKHKDGILILPLQAKY